MDRVKGGPQRERDFGVSGVKSNGRCLRPQALRELGDTNYGS